MTTEMEMDQLDRIAADAFEGYLVRKDLVRKYARQYPVPTYVVEFMLGRYCASTDPAEIAEGLEIVEKQLQGRTVRSGDEELFKSRAREAGSVKLIDIVRAKLDAKNDCYVAELPSLALKDVQITDAIHRHRGKVFSDPGEDVLEAFGGHFSLLSIASQIMPGVLVPLKRSIS